MIEITQGAIDELARVLGSINPNPGQPGDTTPPTTPGSVQASATSATTGTVTWTASTDDVGVAGYEVFVDGSPVDTTTNLSYSLTGLSPSIQYSVTVTAFDAAGNNSVAGGPALFTTDANSAPVWSLASQAPNVGTAVNILFDDFCTDADGDTITYSHVSGSLPSGLALSGSRNEVLSGTTDTVETQDVTFTASDGIAAPVGTDITFYVTDPDVIAPDAPTGLAVTATTSSYIRLDWDDNTEPDLDYYEVQRSTAGASGPWGRRNPVSPPLTVSAYQDTGLSASTPYWYRVRAVDLSGNISPTSSVVTDTTSAASAAPYDLYGTDTQSRGVIPFAVNWPALPSGLIPVTATTHAQLQAAINLGGRHITYSGTSSSSISINTNNVQIDMAAGSSFGNLDIPSAQYVKILGLDPRNNQIASATIGTSAADLTFDGIYSTGVDGFLMYGPQRVAILNSDLNHSTQYTIANWNFGAPQGQDIIIANTRAVANGIGASFRLQGVERLVIVDTLGDTINSGYATLRLEFDCHYAWVRNFTGFGGGYTIDPQVGSPRPTATCHNLTYYDNNVYHTSFISVDNTDGELGDTSKVYAITMDDVLFHTNSGTPGATIFGVQANAEWTVGTAEYAAYSGYPSWSFQ